MMVQGTWYQCWAAYHHGGALYIQYSSRIADIGQGLLLSKWKQLPTFLSKVAYYLEKEPHMFYLLEVKKGKPRQFRISVCAETSTKPLADVIDSDVQREWESIGVYADQEILMTTLESYLRIEEST